MKRSIILLVLSLLTAIASFTQTTYPKNLNDSLVVITAEQLKQTNLIFIEHDHLTKENVLLKSKISLQDSLIYNYSQIDSIQKNNIIKLTDQVNFANSKINRLEKQFKIYKPVAYISSGALITTLLILLLK